MTPLIDPRRLRADAVGAILDRQSGHVMSSLSVSDIVAVLVEWWVTQERDLGPGSADLILSKGHAAPALYAALEQVHPELELTGSNLRRAGSVFHGHPRAGALPSVIVSTGSLGVGVAFAVGRALARRSSGYAGQVIVIASDGEFQEGLTWEALQIAGRLNLNNLLVIVDANHWQTSGRVPESSSPGRYRLPVEFEMSEIDGHDPDSIGSAVTQVATKPRLVVARTSRVHYLPSVGNNMELYGDKVSPELDRILRVDLGIPLLAREAT